MNRLVYVVGYPAAGKTTATMLALGDDITEVRDKPFKHTLYRDWTVELGYRRPQHGGTDGLSFNVQPKVISWLPTCTAQVVVGEGDRLSNNNFFNAVQEQGRRLKIVHIKVGELVALRRMMNRGSRFDPAWVRRTMTKVDNLVSRWRDHVVTIDGKQNVEATAETLAGIMYGT